jgi:energy-coupling factor transport system substrate-specific component
MASTFSTTEKKPMFAFGTREIVFAAIGAALYGVLAYATNLLQIPSAANVSFRPAVALVFFFGLAFGPWVGLFAGFVGNTLADLLSGYGFWFWWSLGNGLMGFVAGLFAAGIVNFRSLSTLIKGEIAVVLGAFVGMGVASLSEMWMSGADWATVVGANFVPAFVGNIVNGLILVPILLVAYSAIVSRSGR